MKKLVLFSNLLFLFAWSCTEKKNFNIPNGNYPDYKLGDSLIFVNDAGNKRVLYCSYFNHSFEIRRSEKKEYTYEYYTAWFLPISGKGILTLTIGWDILQWNFPPGNTDSTQFVLHWDGLNSGKIYSETILGIRNDQVVKVGCNCPNPDRHYIKTDLKKGLLTFFDSTGTLWQFKEKRR